MVSFWNKRETTIRSVKRKSKHENMYCMNISLFPIDSHIGTCHLSFHTLSNIISHYQEFYIFARSVMQREKIRIKWRSITSQFYVRLVVWCSAQSAVLWYWNLEHESFYKHRLFFLHVVSFTACSVAFCVLIENFLYRSEFVTLNLKWKQHTLPSILSSIDLHEKKIRTVSNIPLLCIYQFWSKWNERTEMKFSQFHKLISHRVKSISLFFSSSNFIKCHLRDWLAKS